MGNKFTTEDVNDAFRKGRRFGQSESNKAEYERGVNDGAAAAEEAASGESGSTEEHGEYTLTVRYKHTKYAHEDNDSIIDLVKELNEDEFRFVTDHFDVISVSVDAS